MAGTGPESVKSAVRALEILETVVRQNRPMAAHEIATTLAIPVSSLSYLLTTLQQQDYLRREGRHYRPGPALDRLRPDRGSPSLKELVDPLVRALRDQLNETVTFFVRRGHVIEALSTEIGLHALRYTVNVGQRAPMHSMSAGKALLAAMADAEVEHYLATSERQRFTANTICDPSSLRREVEQVKATGVARTREEQTAGILGFAKAVTCDGEAVGAFAVAIPVARHSDAFEAQIVDLLGRSAKVLADSLAAAD